MANQADVSERERSRQAEEGDHPEADRSYDRERSGQVPDEQGDRDKAYEGPDPDDEPAGPGDDEGQGI
jgi:hypothetical protein